MRTSNSLRWLVVAVSAAMLLAVVAACSSETIEVPGETVVVKEEVIKTVEVPGDTVVKEVIKEVQVPGETVVVKEEVVKEVMVPGETVVVEKEVVKTVEVPGETVTVEVVKEVQVPGETVVVEKVVTQTVQVPGETVVVEKEVVKTVEVPGQTVVVEKEVVKTVAGPERIVVKEVVGDRWARNALGKVVEAPQYGGILVGLVGSEPTMGPDPINPRQNWVTHWIHEFLATLDWAKGPAGTGDWWSKAGWYTFDSSRLPEFSAGKLAESWEQPDPETTIFHIRKGVYFHDRPPVNGREMTAADVAYSFSRYLGLGYAGFEEGLMQRGVSVLREALTSVEVPDKYTVVFKHKPDALLMDRFLFSGSEPVDLVTAQEAVEQEGGYNEYMKLVGTGPFMLDEHVLDSAFHFVRNPNYWDYDSLHPENRLPYLDGIKILVVPDASTQLAALRAGKQSAHFTSDWQIVEQLAQTHPNLVRSALVAPATSLFVANDSPPFDDIRVRRALQMAIDIDEYVETYFGGYADPVLYPMLGLEGYYTPFDELPQEVQDSYAYNPVRAKDLLIEAGYGEGNPLKFTMYHTYAGYGFDEQFLIFRDYFAALGVPMDVDIKSMESAAYFDMIRNADRTLFSGMAHGQSGLTYPITYAENTLGKFTSDGVAPFHINDPDYDAMHERLVELEAGTDEWHALLKELNDYAFTQNWFIAMPTSFMYSLSQPWLHNYTGGYGLTWSFLDGALPHMWIDQDLKGKLGH